MEYLKIEKSQDGLFAKFTELKNNVALYNTQLENS